MGILGWPSPPRCTLLVWQVGGSVCGVELLKVSFTEEQLDSKLAFSVGAPPQGLSVGLFSLSLELSLVLLEQGRLLLKCSFQCSHNPVPRSPVASTSPENKAPIFWDEIRRSLGPWGQWVSNWSLYRLPADGVSSPMPYFLLWPTLIPLITRPPEALHGKIASWHCYRPLQVFIFFCSTKSHHHTSTFCSHLQIRVTDVTYFLSKKELKFLFPILFWKDLIEGRKFFICHFKNRR